MLKKQVERLKALNATAFFASELEFYLFDESYRTLHERDFREPRTSGYYIEDYNVLQTTREDGVMRAMRTGLQAAGISIANTKGDWGAGQEELNAQSAAARERANHPM